MDVYPKNELLDKLQKLRLFPKLAEKYSFKNDDLLIEKMNNLNAKDAKNLNPKIQKKIEYDIFKEIEHPEFIDNVIKSPRIRRIRTFGNELILKSPPVGRFYSKIKKN